MHQAGLDYSTVSVEPWFGPAQPEQQENGSNAAPHLLSCCNTHRRHGLHRVQPLTAPACRSAVYPRPSDPTTRSEPSFVRAVARESFCAPARRLEMLSSDDSPDDSVMAYSCNPCGEHLPQL